MRPDASGAPAFLFTDIEGSTALWESDPEGMAPALAAHDAALDEAVAAAGGRIFKRLGDGVCAVFGEAPAALAAALGAQRRLAGLATPAGGPVRARMAIHAGPAEARDDDWFGPALNRVARLLAVAHGGQILVSAAARERAADGLPAGVELVDLGRHRLKDLEAPLGVWQLAHPELPADFPPIRTLDAVRHNLPLQATAFIGREREMTAVLERLDAHRLVTLIGPGGTGKTRLALQAAAERVDREPDGVWLVRLEALEEPELVAEAVAAAVGLPEAAGRTAAALAGALRDRRLLIVLDNCEHLIEPCAELAQELLAGCPRVHTLATSRELLAVAGEVVIPVGPMDGIAAPDDEDPLAVAADSTAVRLFVDRARMVRPEFTLTAENAADLLELCRRLDGSPLALELAAARAAALAPRDMLERLDERFRLLDAGPRSLRPRHRSLRATIEWSHDLLDPAEQVLFRRLAVFAGEWNLAAADAICGDENTGGDLPPEDVSRVLVRLVVKSLVAVRQPGDDTGGETRYAFLDTIRAYARERLVESGEAVERARRHARWYADRAQAVERDLFGPGQRAAYDWFEREQPNLRVALARALEPDWEPDDALLFAHAMYPFWIRRGGPGHRLEGARWLERAVERSADLSLRARGWFMAGQLLRGLDPAATRAASERCLEEARASGNLRRIVGGLIAIATCDMDDGLDPEATLEEAVETARRAEVQPVLAFALNVSGEAARLAGRMERAGELYAEALAYERELGDGLQQAVLLGNLAHVALARGRPGVARKLWWDTLRLALRVETPDYVAGALEGLAAVAVGDDPRRAARLYGAAQRIRDERSWPQDPADRLTHDRAWRLLRSQLPEEDVRAERAAGRELTLEAALAEAGYEPDGGGSRAGSSG